MFFVYLFLFLPLTALVVFTDYVHSFRPKWFPRLFLFYFCTFTELVAAPRSKVPPLNDNITSTCVRGIHVNESRSRGWLSAQPSCQPSRVSRRAMFFLPRNKNSVAVHLHVSVNVVAFFPTRWWELPVTVYVQMAIFRSMNMYVWDLWLGCGNKGRKIKVSMEWSTIIHLTDRITPQVNTDKNTR